MPCYAEVTTTSGGHAMCTILAIDLGKFKSVICVLNGATGEAEFRTVTTTPDLLRLRMDRVVV
jgi:hypothetical protein